MIGRIIWLAAVLAVAVLTTLLQLDKQSETTPALAAAVPAPLRDFAQTRITAAAIEAGDPAIALSEAERLVRRRPVPAEYLTLLAIAQAKAGEAEQAALTIQIAGQRGWREPLAQETVLRLALQAGDQPEAARRYAALFLRSATPDALLIELGPQVLGEPSGPGRKTIAEIVSGAERWHNLFLRRGLQVMPTDAFIEIVTTGMAQGAAFDCGLLAQSVKGMQQRDAVAAERLLQAVSQRCG